jgi:hypothetical protein
MPNIIVEKDFLLVESINSVGKYQATPPTYDIESVHMHVIATNYVVATSSIELEIH